MELPVAVQLREAGWFLLMGAGLGLVYDILGSLRDRTGRLAGAAMDVLFVLIAMAVLFTAGMATLEGRMHLYMLLVACLGGCLWAWAVSPVTRPAFRRVWRTISGFFHVLTWPCRIMKRFIRKLCKKVFSKWKRRFTIKYNAEKGKKMASGKEAERYKDLSRKRSAGGSCTYWPAGLCYYHPAEYADQGDGRLQNSSRPPGTGGTASGGKRRFAVRHRKPGRSGGS